MLYCFSEAVCNLFFSNAQCHLASICANECLSVRKVFPESMEPPHLHLHLTHLKVAWEERKEKRGVGVAGVFWCSVAGHTWCPYEVSFYLFLCLRFVVQYLCWEGHCYISYTIMLILLPLDLYANNFLQSKRFWWYLIPFLFDFGSLPDLSCLPYCTWYHLVFHSLNLLFLKECSILDC